MKVYNIRRSISGILFLFLVLYQNTTGATSSPKYIRTASGVSAHATMGVLLQQENTNNKSQPLITNGSEQLRAEFENYHGSSLNLCVKYNGAVDVVKKFRSGIVKKQIGLKVKARDTCNLLYVMWRISDKNKIVFLKKINPGKSKHKECLNNGYKVVRSFPVPTALDDGRFHLFAVNLAKDKLTITVDSKIVGEEILDKEMLDLNGPFGLRSDNSYFLFQLGFDGKIPSECSQYAPTTQNPAENHIKTS